MRVLRRRQECGKEFSDKLNMNYLSEFDILVCNYVAEQLAGIDIGKVNYGGVITYDELVEKSCDEIKIFGDDIYSEIREILTDVPIYRKIFNKDFFNTKIRFIVSNNGMVYPESGIVDRYIIPRKLYELSVICFGHENVHALKDTNYSEFHNGITLGEVIPIFFELIASSDDEELKRETIKLRLRNLLYNKKQFEKFDGLVMIDSINKGINIEDDSSMSLYLCSCVGVYLNSFYYASILYSMYKVTPGKILNLVSRVLKHEITTLDMLNYLGIYGSIQGEIFERELRQIRKLIK